MYMYNNPDGILSVFLTAHVYYACLTSYLICI